MTTDRSSRRRPSSGSRGRTSRKRHPASGARIVTAGLGATTMLGIVAGMGVADAVTSSEPTTLDADSASVPPAQPRVIVRIHRPAAPTPTTVAAELATGPAEVTDTTTPPEPVVLSARPDVRVVTAPAARSGSSNRSNQQAAPTPAPAPAPAATTSGSR